VAIQFARCEYLSRSGGGNACRKASYNQREAVRCERTGELFSFKERGGNAYHEILLPEGAHEKFKNSAALWNEVEACERRINSQLAKEFVLALPDDAQVTVEDRIELTRRFSRIFVEKGVAVQMDVHFPHNGEKNWHAHLLVTTRRFSEDGLTFGAKARDLDPIIRGGKVVEANLWGEIWRDLQNDYFGEKGYDLRVDPIGILPQEHLGPVRMRHHLNEAVLRAELLQKANEKIAQNPSAVLEELTRTRAVFSQKEVALFLRKHVPEIEREGLLERVLEHPNVLTLYNKETKESSGYFTTKEVRAGEEKLLRFADSIASKSIRHLPSRSIAKGLENRTLSDEQKKAYDLCVSSGQNLNIIQGRAGVGKSYVLGAIREAHEASGFRVLGLAPTNKVAMDLKNDGFRDAKTCHSFLFMVKNGREKLDLNTLVIVDEAGMLGTTLSVELFNVVKNSGAKLVLVGDDRQLSSVERGGTFKFLSERYGAAELQNVRRQTIGWQKEVSEALAEGHVKTAVHLLEENKAIAWIHTKEEAFSNLLNDWAKDSLLKPHEIRQIITQKNVDVDALNQGARDILRARGQLGETEIICSTGRGRTAFAEGDRIQFNQKDQEQGLMNGSFGTIEHIEPKTRKLTVLLDNKETKIVNPDTYGGLRHGYAATVYKAQGATLGQVYVLHSNTTTQSTNYVALTRQTKSLGLYVAQDEAPTPSALIHQISRPDGNRTSLVFDTQREIEKNQEEKTFSTQLKHGAETLITKIQDAFHKNEKFYHVEKQTNTNQEKAKIVDYKASDEPKKGNTLHQKDEEGLPQPHQTQEISPSKPQAGPVKRAPQALDAKTVEDALRQNMAPFADDIFSSIGEPYNPASSSVTERRYGKNGHIAVNLKTGAWIDYKDDSLSGGPLHMLTKIKGLSFKEALDYGANWAGLSRATSQSELSRIERSQTELSQPSLENSILKTHEFSSPSGIKEDLDKETRVKIAKAQALWNKGQPLQGTVAERYLKEHRKIEGNREWPQDLRYLPHVKVAGGQDSHAAYPCLMVAARSKEGDITAVQLTFLDQKTANKAPIPVQKRSFGLLKGSSVVIQSSPLKEKESGEHKMPHLLFIAEGVETALSLREAGIEGTIKASLGLANIKRIEAQDPKTHIVICGDHDAPDSPAAKNLEKSVMALQERDLYVTVLKPNLLGEDFNDVLKAKGPTGVREVLKQAVPHALTDGTIVKDSNSSASISQGLGPSPSLSPSPNNTKEDVQKLLGQIIKTCEELLYTYIAKENISLTPELKERIPLQAERAANFIFHVHTLQGTIPTEKETKIFLLRAKYELDRIPQIKEKLRDEWHKRGKLNETSSSLMIHVIAERQASIEGRLFLEAKEAGQKLSPHIPQLAVIEFNNNKAQTKVLAQDLKIQYSLSERASKECAKNILRHQETHGTKPTDTQRAAMAEIAHQLEDKPLAPFEKEVGAHSITYLNRMKADTLFRERCYELKTSIAQERNIIKMQEKALLEVQRQRIEQEVSKQKRDFSMSM
jgi:Ti-type conjugative transfer relaxase TraA